MKKFILLIILIFCINLLHAQQNDRLGYYSCGYASIKYDSIFFKYKTPIENFNKILEITGVKDCCPRISIGVFVRWRMNGKMGKISIDRLKSLSSDYFDDNHQIWKILEDSIRYASQYWEVKPLYLKDVPTRGKYDVKIEDNTLWNGGEAQVHYIVFTYFNNTSEPEIDRRYWIKHAF